MILATSIPLPAGERGQHDFLSLALLSVQTKQLACTAQRPAKHNWFADTQDAKLGSQQALKTEDSSLSVHRSIRKSAGALEAPLRQGTSMLSQAWEDSRNLCSQGCFCKGNS